MSDDFYMIDVDHNEMPIEEPGFFSKVFNAFKRSIYGFTSYVKKSVVGKTAKYCTDIVLNKFSINGQKLRDNINDAYEAAENGSEELDEKIDKIIDVIPDKRLKEIADLSGKVLPAIVSSAGTYTLKQIPIAGSAFAVSNSVAKGIRNGLFPEVRIVEKIIQSNSKNVAYSSALNRFFQNKTKTEIKGVLHKVLKEVFKAAPKYIASLSQELEISEHSVLDDTSIHFDSGNSYRKIDADTLRKEYLKAWIQVQTANVVGEDFRKLLVSARNNVLDPIGDLTGLATYDSENPIKGYLYDIISGTAPRFIVDIVMKTILTNNWNATDAKTKLINAKEIVESLNMDPNVLQEPTASEIKDIVKMISDGNNMFGFYKARNDAIKYANQMAIQFCEDSVKELLSRTKSCGEETFEWTKDKTVLSKCFGPSKKKLSEVKKIYDQRIESLKNIQQELKSKDISQDKFASLMKRAESLMKCSVQNKLKRLNLSEHGKTISFLDNQNLRLDVERRKMLSAFETKLIVKKPRNQNKQLSLPLSKLGG